MIPPLLALAGMNSGELLILLAACGIGSMLVVGVGTVISYVIIRIRARKAPDTLPGPAARPK